MDVEQYCASSDKILVRAVIVTMSLCCVQDAVMVLVTKKRLRRFYLKPYYSIWID